jgi:rhamnogalacturonyl hydrolase YesR
MVKKALGPGVFDKLHPDAQQALVDLSYNGGTASCGLNPGLAKLINQGVAAQEAGNFDAAHKFFEQAAKSIIDARKNTHPILQNRGQEIANLFQNGATAGIKNQEQEWEQLRAAIPEIVAFWKNPTLETLQKVHRDFQGPSR